MDTNTLDTLTPGAVAGHAMSTFLASDQMRTASNTRRNEWIRQEKKRAKLLADPALWTAGIDTARAVIEARGAEVVVPSEDVKRVAAMILRAAGLTTTGSTSFEMVPGGGTTYTLALFGVSK